MNQSTSEKAKADAATEGVTVTEEAEKSNHLPPAAEADNKAQTAEINTVVENYKSAKADEAKTSRNHIDWKRNAEEQKQIGQSSEAEYNQQKAAYDKALEEYNAKRQLMIK